MNTTTDRPSYLTEWLQRSIYVVRSADLLAYRKTYQDDAAAHALIDAEIERRASLATTERR